MGFHARSSSSIRISRVRAALCVAQAVRPGAEADRLAHRERRRTDLRTDRNSSKRDNMQGMASSVHESSAAARPAADHTVAGSNSAYQGYQILRRNGAVVSFEPSKIAVALMKAFLAVHGTQGA